MSVQETTKAVSLAAAGATADAAVSASCFILACAVVCVAAGASGAVAAIACDAAASATCATAAASHLLQARMCGSSYHG